MLLNEPVQDNPSKCASGNTAFALRFLVVLRSEATAATVLCRSRAYVIVRSTPLRLHAAGRRRPPPVGYVAFYPQERRSGQPWPVVVHDAVGGRAAWTY
jgi:hypothetical protein